MAGNTTYVNYNFVVAKPLVRINLLSFPLPSTLFTLRVKFWTLWSLRFFGEVIFTLLPLTTSKVCLIEGYIEKKEETRICSHDMLTGVLRRGRRVESESGRKVDTI